MVFFAVTATIGHGACNFDKLKAVSPVVNNKISLTFKLISIRLFTYKHFLLHFKQ